MNETRRDEPPCIYLCSLTHPHHTTRKPKLTHHPQGARGIGRMITEGFVANGAKVYVASRDAAACEAAAAELSARGPGSCVAIPADLLRLSECERLASELRAREARLHVLVNNSGAAWGAPLSDFPDAQWSRVLTLNLQRAFTLTQLLLPLLEAAGDESGDGKDGGGTGDNPAAVINIGSINGLSVPNLEVSDVIRCDAMPST